MSTDLLEELVKEGSDILMKVGDDMISKLTEALDLEDMMGVKCEMRFKTHTDEGSKTDHDIDNPYNEEEDTESKLQEVVTVKNRFKSAPLDKSIPIKKNPGVNTSRTSTNHKFLRSKTVLRSFANVEDEIDAKPQSKC